MLSTMPSVARPSPQRKLFFSPPLLIRTQTLLLIPFQKQKLRLIRFQMSGMIMPIMNMTNMKMTNTNILARGRDGCS